MNSTQFMYPKFEEKDKQNLNENTQMQIDNSSGFNLPIQSTNQTQITNSAANKEVIESSNTVINPHEFPHPIINNKNNIDNFNNRNNNDLIYNRLEDNLIIPRNYNENRPSAIRPRTRSKKLIFCVSLSIILLLLVLLLLFLVFFTNFFRENYIPYITTNYSNLVRKPERKDKVILDVLSKLQIECPDQSLLSSFNLETQDYQNYYYKFICIETLFSITRPSILKESNTVYYDEKIDNVFEALSQLSIICPTDYAVKGLKLNYDSDKRLIYYSYSCLEIQGSSRFTVDYRNYSHESIRVDEDDINSILDLKCIDDDKIFRFLNMIQLNYKEDYRHKRAFYSMTSCGLEK